MKHYFILFCFFTLYSFSDLFAQQNASSLEQRWTKMLDHAETYEPYKVIDKKELYSFWNATCDSLKSYQRVVKREKSKTAAQASTITSLKKELGETSALLQASKQESDSLTYLGFTANKYFYLSVLYVLLLCALVGIGFLYYLYKNSQLETVEKTTACQKITQEFNEYKQVKFEAEKKLKRELQTQWNTIEELKRGH